LSSEEKSSASDASHPGFVEKGMKMATVAETD